MLDPEKLDKILSQLDSLHRRMDALEDDPEDGDRDGDPLAEKGTPRRDAARVERQLADLERRIPAEVSKSDREKFVDAQAKAERVARAFGDSSSRWVNGETLTEYRQRLLSKVKEHSARWKGVDVRKLTGAALDTAETQVYADAWAAATDASNVPVGTLRQVIEVDETGRTIRKFYGDPEACWGPFKQPTRIVTAWNANRPTQQGDKP